MKINCSFDGSLPIKSQTHFIVDQGQSSAQSSANDIDWCNTDWVTIKMLPDDALLYIFDFYVAQNPDIEVWHTLVHVCPQWRILVFMSPHCLNLWIECMGDTSVVNLLDICLALPIIISGNYNPMTFDNIKAILEHHDHVCQIVCHRR